VHLLDHVKDAELRLYVLPVALQSIFIERRAIGNDPLGVESALFEGLQKRVHVVLIVFLDQFEGHRKVPERLGGKQDGATTIVDCIDAQHS